MKYKHYSFDLWLTLIKSDPKFKQERDKYFYTHFNRGVQFSQEEVSAIIRDIDITCNAVNEIAGGSISPLEMYAMILRKLNYPTENLGINDLFAIYHKIEALFFKHPPQPYCKDTIPTLLKLKEKGASLSLISNTGFISGDTLDRLFDAHFPLHVAGVSMKNLFSFRLYSDRFQCSKPSRKFFQLMEDLCGNLHQLTAKDKILHVGDNPFADGEGAKRAGLDHYIINSNKQTIKDLLTL
jgi:putative hydrolase of the HAD superfamily